MSTGIAQHSESDLATMDMALVGRVKQGDLVRVMRERNWTQKELGVFLGLDQHRIRAIEAKALRKLRHGTSLSELASVY